MNKKFYDTILTQVPKYETPEQYKERTGKDYPDDVPVWVRLCQHTEWNLSTAAAGTLYQDIVIANKNGKPPIDWKPL